MKIAANIVGALLGLFFVFSGAVVLFKLVDIPAPPPGSVFEQFNKLFGDGWMQLIKACEIVGGLLLAIPKTRNFGLLFLGPIVINILAFHQFAAKDGLFQPVLIVITLASLFLLWAGREKFANLAN
ncbi:MAG: hypothetical protein JSR82_08805 [Verrucomicrobia bacterium]|nr:hypothetical protein [Verrucomicrobiota bacterium]